MDLDTKISGEINGLTQTLGDLATQISGEIDDLTKTVMDLDTRISGEINSLDTSLSDLNTEVSNLKTSVNDIRTTLCLFTALKRKEAKSGDQHDTDNAKATVDTDAYVTDVTDLNAIDTVEGRNLEFIRNFELVGNQTPLQCTNSGGLEWKNPV